MTWSFDQSVRPFRNSAYATVVSGGVLAALAVFLIYWPARENGFVWDDWNVLDILKSAGMRDPALWRETLLRPPADFSVLFRPLTMLTIALQLWTGEPEARSFHIANLVIHSVNVFLLVLIAWRLLDRGASRAFTRPGLAVLCGLIYGVHPALIEPVVWISARSDLLLAFFLSLALLFDRALPETGWKRALAVGASFLAAMLCKESAVGFLAALPIVHLAVNWQRPGPPEFGALARALAPHYRVYIALPGALALYFAVRFAVAGPQFGLEGVITPARYIDSFGQHVLVVIASLTQHIWSVLWPFQDIVPGRYLPLPINGTELLPKAVASAGVVGVALGAVCLSSAGRVPALLFLAFVASLLPVANIVPIPAVVIPSEVAAGSRYVTFPLIFACLAVPFVIRIAGASLMKQVRYGRALIWVIAGAWILASIANVRVTIPLWSNDVVLNTWAIKQGGASFWRHAHIGSYYLLTGDYSRSREASLAALKLRDDDQTAWVWNNLGVAEAALGHAAEAMKAFRRALDLGTDEIKTRINIASLERQGGNPQAAVDVLEVGLRRIEESGRRHRREAQLRYHLGLAYGALGRSEEATVQLSAALALSRDPERRKIMEEALRSVAPK